MPTTVVLGSASPARLTVLRAAGLSPLVVVSDVDEDAIVDALGDAEPASIVKTLSQAKAEAIVAAVTGGTDPAFNGAREDGVILTCDSMLLLDGELSGKPHSPEVAIAQWQRMRGNVGHLLTGHTVTRIVGGVVSSVASDHQSTAVRFANISDEVIARYVATGEPLSVAGAFTLDARGGWFVDGIDGDPSSVIGISLPLTRRLLDHVGINVAELWIG